MNRQAKELGKCFNSPERSRVVFEGQLITVTAADVKLIERGEALNALSEWWQQWPSHRRAKVVLGEEGNGKTWAVAAWAARQPTIQCTVFVNARAAKSPNPSQLLASAVSSLIDDADPERWRKRINRWVTFQTTDRPVVLLVLDGINERHAPAWWQALFDRLQERPWSSAVATIITCRTSYWRQYFGPLDHLKWSESEIGPFSEAELSEALRRHGLRRSEFDEGLVRLLRKPRYLAMQTPNARDACWRFYGIQAPVRFNL